MKFQDLLEEINATTGLTLNGGDIYSFLDFDNMEFEDENDEFETVYSHMQSNAIFYAPRHPSILPIEDQKIDIKSTELEDFIRMFVENEVKIEAILGELNDDD